MRGNPVGFRKEMRMKKRSILILWVGLFFAAVVLSACAQAAPVTLGGAEKEAVLTFSEPMTDRLVGGLNASDYAAFSQDFNDQMKQGIPEKNFAGLVASITGKAGKLTSRQVTAVEKMGEQYYRVTYAPVFEKAQGITMYVTFESAAPHKVAGLFFTGDALK
jgi:hypothetical protein